MKWIAATLLLCCWMVGYSQNSTELKRRAKEFIAAGRYEDAIATLNNSRELSRSDAEGRFLLAVCYFQVNQINESLNILKTLTETEKTPYPECWFYLGKIYHARHQFLEAALNYKMYLRYTSGDENIRRVVADMIRRCSNGQQLQYQAAKAFVENLGAPVNSKYDEFAPVLSPNYEDRLYFSAIREGNAGGKRNKQGKPDERGGAYFSDMFVCSNKDGVWSNLQPMPYQLNSPRHEVLLDFNKDGTALIYLKGLDVKNGEIIVDTFRQLEQRLVSSDPLLAPVRPDLGDETPCFYNDTLIVFASNRAGGYGGLDLYKTVLRNGRWTNPENLGADINTAYDETTPYLSRDGRTLYFSSSYPERSIGGLDVFKAVFIPEINRWTEPKNLGLPINSAGDDEYFRLANDGFTGFFTSNRKDGIGMRDLYIAYFNDYLAEQDLPAIDLAEVPPSKVGTKTTTAPNQPTDASVIPDRNKVKPTSVAEQNAIYFNSTNDVLTAGNQRILDEFGVELVGDAERKLVLTAYAMSAPTLSGGLFNAITYAEKVAQYLVEKGIAPEAIFMRAAVPVGDAASNYGKFAMLLETNETKDFQPKGEVKPGYDPMLHEGLHYKVQIVSTKNEYKGDLLKQFPHPMIEKTLTFEYFRYTVGAVKTFAEAQRLRQAVIAKGISSAFIVPYINGIRADNGQVKQYQHIYPDLSNFLKK
ncbi:MAG: tetratricopeptide repeat protein [Saprospiraceae bacterium]